MGHVANGAVQRASDIGRRVYRGAAGSGSAFALRARTQAWSRVVGGDPAAKFAPVTIAALLATLILIFAFQADSITGRFFHVVLLALPVTLQVYLNASLAYGLMKLVGVLVEVPVMLSVCAACNRTRHWFPEASHGRDPFLKLL